MAAMLAPIKRPFNADAREVRAGFMSRHVTE
jgi:hypothetical protein